MVKKILLGSEKYYPTLSLAISGYPWPSQATTGYLRISRAILYYLRLSWAICDCIRLYRPILGFPRLDPDISGYFWLSLAISSYLWHSQAISRYLWQSLSSNIYQGTSWSRREQAIAIRNFFILCLFFTGAIPRGTRTPKNSVLWQELTTTTVESDLELCIGRKIRVLKL